MSKREVAEQGALGAVGITGMIAPNYIEIGDAFQTITIVFSFFFIVVPTGIWASIRAYNSIMKCIEEKRKR